MSGRVQKRFAWRLEVLIGLAIWVFASSASAQATPGPPHVQDSKGNKAIPAVIGPVQQQPHPAAPIYGATSPEQTLPQPPEVVWDGKQLTIDAENSRLADILLAVRAKTGASVDFPGGATSERVAVHLGPAPVREVLSSLLYGTDFDYVIQAADDDEDGLRSVVVTLRGAKGDDALGPDASEVAADAAKTPGMRLMRGWAAPGKPAFQVEAEAALAAKQAEAEAALAAKQAEAEGAAATETDAAVATPGQGSAGSSAESAAAGSPTANSAASAADGSTVTVSDIPPTTAAAATQASSSGDSAREQSEADQRVQSMMNMFEQRRQIQARQNQPPTPPAAN